ncbi:MAG: response regulator [Planctomycetes bacterium]|nr:response regulator [Planctomycetota bacterium]
MADGPPADPTSERDRNLLAQGQRYAALVAHSPYCIHEIDAEGNLCSMNPAGLEMMDVVNECEIVGLDYLSVVCEEDLPRIRHLLQEALAGKLSEFEFTTTTGRIVSSNFVPIEESAGLPARLMGITQDVTERKALESQLRQSLQLEAIGRLAGGIAHDFNNLLTVIMGSADHLRLRMKTPATNEVETILQASRRAADLTSQLLTFAGRQHVSPRWIDATRAIREARPLLEGLLNENTRLDLPPEPSSAQELVVLIDPVQLDRVLVNLVSNASDAVGPGGGLIRVSIQAARLAGADANPAGLADGAYAEILVSDDGCGMSPEATARLFEPLFTTKLRGKNCHGGTGLGLATCHGILGQAHGGIVVTSDSEPGTTVGVYLPLGGGEKNETPVRATSREPAANSVLVVEDDPMVRAVFQRALEFGGYDVIVAANAEEALEVPTTHYDLLLTDVGLPGKSGLELAEALLAERPELPVICTSGHLGETPLQAERLGEHVTFLAKPYPVDALLAAIREVLGPASDCKSLTQSNTG